MTIKKTNLSRQTLLCDTVR